MIAGGAIAPAAAGPPPPVGAPPVFVQVIDGDDVDPAPKLLDVGVVRYRLDEATERFDGAIGVISVAAAGGRPQRVGRFGFEPGGGASEHSVDPCTIGGKDLPDERFTVTVEFADVSPPNSFSRELRLGPDTTAPKVKRIQSSPPPGSKVEQGDTIRFEVVGREDIPGETWQTGVQTLQVIGPRGVIKDKNAGRLPKACENKSESLTIEGKYKVRASDPGVIEICGMADDFAGNPGSNCAKYYKGEVWEGTLRTDVDPCRALGTPLVLEGPVTVVVAPDGSVTGGGTLTLTEAGGSPEYGCYTGVAAGGQMPVEITGNRDRQGFHLTAFDAPIELMVSGKTAEGTTSLGGETTETIKLTCKTCDE